MSVNGSWKLAVSGLLWATVAYTGWLTLVPLACLWLLWGAKDIAR